jgi:undecaprenyl-diphosphatase
VTAVLAHELDYSFPSGHATGATALALTVILLVVALESRHRHLWIALAGGYGIAICLSRLLLGVHYVTDILGAVALATGGVLAIGWACARTSAPSATTRSVAR